MIGVVQRTPVVYPDAFPRVGGRLLVCVAFGILHLRAAIIRQEERQGRMSVVIVSAERERRQTSFLLVVAVLNVELYFHPAEKHKSPFGRHKQHVALWGDLDKEILSSIVAALKRRARDEANK